MKALLVSRLGLHHRIIEKLRTYRITEIEDYFKHKNTWRTVEDVVKIARKVNADCVIVITNFRLAMELLTRGFRKVIVITPKIHTITDILYADITIIEGEVKAIRFTV